MAGDWIKMRNDLSEDPAVIGIAALTGTDEFSVIGRLQTVWSWADRQSRDGHAAYVTSAWLNRKVQCDGFAEAMVKVGWLTVDETGITFPKFGNHNGETAKTRALGTNRKQKQRAKDAVTPDVASVSTDASRSERDKSETREEKRREEISPSLRSGDGAQKRAAKFDPSAVDLPECVSSDDWARWCADRSKRSKPVTAEAAKLQLAKLVAFMAEGHLPKDVIDHSIAGGYQGLYAPRLKPATGLSGGHTGFAQKDYRKGVSDDGYFA